MTAAVHVKCSTLCTPLLLAWYLTLFGGHPFAGTTVTENAPAKIVAVNDGNHDLQVVVAAPWGGGRLCLIERPQTNYWYAYQWPEITSDSDTVDVCYMYDANPRFAVVDIDCESVHWAAFCSNFIQGAAFLLLVYMTGISAAHFAASLVATFRMQAARLSASDGDDGDCDALPLTSKDVV
jgi:hypothetical protein